MSSALVSNFHKQHLPHFADHWGNIGRGHIAREGGCAHTPPLLGNGPYRGTHFNPPPARRDMIGNNGNPLLNPSLGGQSYQRVPVVASNAPPYASAHATSDNTKTSSGRQPFYNSYYSNKRLQSPPLQKDHAAQSEQTARRRASSDGNSIASHLQIPSSINDSKGSLPEFAAQVRLKPSLTSFPC